MDKLHQMNRVFPYVFKPLGQNRRYVVALIRSHSDGPVRNNGFNSPFLEVLAQLLLGYLGLLRVSLLAGLLEVSIEALQFTVRLFRNDEVDAFLSDLVVQLERLVLCRQDIVLESRHGVLVIGLYAFEFTHGEKLKHLSGAVHLVDIDVTVLVGSEDDLVVIPRMQRCTVVHWLEIAGASGSIHVIDLQPQRMVRRFRILRSRRTWRRLLAGSDGRKGGGAILLYVYKNELPAFIARVPYREA